MNTAALAVIGWLIPGGAFLLTRRYLRFAGSLTLVTVTFGLGLALHGGYRWPQPVDLEGLDSLTSLSFRAGAVSKLLAGAPFLLASFWGGAHGFLDGRLHEYGTTLLSLAGLFNLLAISNAFELRNAESD
jgi:hypothetical protein